MKKNKAFLGFFLILSSAVTLKAQLYEQPVTGHVAVGTTIIDNAQNWGKVFQLYGAQHSKLLVTNGSGIKIGIFSDPGSNGKIGTESAHNLTFTAGYWNDVMTLTTTGNVGIGTITPTDKLSVNGNIRSKEIKVESANWPDYVFAKSYQLPTLQEVAKYIKENGHLQGIPSAKEVEVNSINLGEINAKLLQKIEELTLHLIRESESNVENQKILSDQAMCIKALSERLKKLEK